MCAGLKRLYVPERLASGIEDALAGVAATIVVGDGTRDGVDMGPIQNKMQFDRVEALTAAARADGAEVYFRGEAPGGPGYFHPVTLVRRATDDMALVAEEQFGPVLPDADLPHLDEAVARANDSDLGLGASVWSGDEDRAVEVAAQLEAGTVWVNQHPMLSPDVPFGGRQAVRARRRVVAVRASRLHRHLRAAGQAVNRARVPGAGISRMSINEGKQRCC